ncbi:MAG: tRNA uridine-5-carboxymethylaminomethyl(34) synthesis GTPase MnmE [Candidatus Aminicenantes bacterium]|nr:tRNA uridine-5-carboxymethylaminomethyl(34) synthesis GTPase MnmE [Candidatus Aminicenantes bacterium]MDH5383247.1 tRNA uridine-5-carboxymethylaminomethyl(34) synthesis GTPase MnmE [Candidatus Aminicenantes bacterium]MDH5743431.1 tRNA uridine-5-carboxymethylaminomethyl(34) synthesis GTPase MnmE [Candidatus Aminicenantes bacterium]
MLDDTIIAVSTPLGFGGLGVVRLSGSRSLSVAKKIFKCKSNTHKIPSLRPVLGNLVNSENKELFEEAYLTFFPKPLTYTREDMVEISCHGSPVILEEVVRLGVQAGARHANPGEFTLRAYLNGRIDIIQAEAVNDIITASSLRQAKISFRQLEGSLSKASSSLRSQIIQLLSRIEARIEFPDDGLRISSKTIVKTLTRAQNTLQKLISSYDLGKTLSEGLSLVIAGRTNVGKSTLFNALLEKDRAIVTPYPGTTRDYLQEKIKISDSIFTLTDMAGIEVPSHPVEKEGIKRGKKLAAAGDGILLVYDITRKETDEDLSLLKKYKSKKIFLLFNKIDLPVKMDVENIKKIAKGIPTLEISALKGTHLDKLKKMVYERFVPTQKESEEVILHFRQKLLLEEVLSCLTQAKHLLEGGHSEEIYAEEIRKTVPLIGQLMGEIRKDEIIEEIFSRFCVGK